MRHCNRSIMLTVCCVSYVDNFLTYRAFNLCLNDDNVAKVLCRVCFPSAGSAAQIKSFGLIQWNEMELEKVSLWHCVSHSSLM